LIQPTEPNQICSGRSVAGTGTKLTYGSTHLGGLLRPCMSSANLSREECPKGTGEIGTRYTLSHQLVQCPPPTICRNKYAYIYIFNIL